MNDLGLLTWQGLFALYLACVVALWRRPLPLPSQGPQWSFEALLLLFAQALVFGLYALGEAAYWHGMRFGAALGAWAAGWWAAYWTLRLGAARGDRLLLPMACLLSGLGFVMQLRLEPLAAFRQATWLLVGLVALMLISAYLRDLRRLHRLRVPLLVLSLLLQGGLFFWGEERNGAALWYVMGPMSFQPVELVKVTTVCILASFLSQAVPFRPAPETPGNEAPEPASSGISRRMLAAMGLGFLVLEGLLTLQRDLGMALLMFGIFLLMFYAVTGRTRWCAFILLLSSVGAALAYRHFGHVRVRVEAWLDPLTHYQDSGYQISEALFALAWGGWRGTGLGLGEPHRVPEALTDFIYVAWCEELGTIGGILLWGLLTLFLLRTFRAFQNLSDPFERLLALGLACLLSWQTAIVLLGILKLMPMTGIALPFISYGGSNLLSNFAILALLQRMSQRDRAPMVSRGPLQRRVHYIVRGFALLFTLIPLRLAEIQLTERMALDEDPHNTRIRERLSRRGRLLSRDGAPLALSRGEERAYPHGDLTGHWTGACDHLSALGGERWKNSLLAEHRFEASGPQPGRDVRLSLDLAWQKKLRRWFTAPAGAAVVLDLDSGELLAAWSAPAFDPRRLGRDWGAWQTDPHTPLLNRPELGLYPAGSLWPALGTVIRKLPRSPALLQDWTAPVQAAQGEWLVSPAQVAAAVLALGSDLPLTQVAVSSRTPWNAQAARSVLPWEVSAGDRWLWSALVRSKQGTQTVAWALRRQGALLSVWLCEEQATLEIARQGALHTLP